tara:strand:- start:234 stop:473 length:240 start_codon:yes stop_codon:yes gene_type:complete
MEGKKVVARVQITEGGGPSNDPSAAFPDYDYIHAEKGELGTVENIDDCNGEMLPTVRFDRTGTATLVNWDEVKIIEVNT